jgi:hypothetical protein
MSRFLLALVLILAGTLGLSIYLRWFRAVDITAGKSSVTVAAGCAWV